MLRLLRINKLLGRPNRPLKKLREKNKENWKKKPKEKSLPLSRKLRKQLHWQRKRLRKKRH